MEKFQLWISVLFQILLILKKGEKLYPIKRPSFFPVFPNFDSLERKISLDKESYSLFTTVPPENLYLSLHFSQSQNTSAKVA